MTETSGMCAHKTIIIPSNFTLQIRGVWDESIEYVLNETWFTFEFSDSYNNKYIADSNPSKGEFINTYIDGEHLYVTFEDYSLQEGYLKMKTTVHIPDEHFPDGYEDKILGTQTLNVILSKSSKKSDIDAVVLEHRRYLEGIKINGVNVPVYMGTALVTLPPIPDNTNLLNGSAEGSLRGINTDEESSEYQLGENAVALGKNTKAEGESSFATGIGSKAENTCSVASGYHSYAKGSYSQADGYDTQTSDTAPYSHAEGCNTQTNNPSEHAQGQFNKSNTDDVPTFGTGSHTLFSIGNGTDLMDSKNAVEVMQNGDMYVQGVGGYDGTNPSESKTLQDIVNTQPDWNQNDETQPDFIKNRICYEQIAGEIYDSRDGESGYTIMDFVPFSKIDAYLNFEELVGRTLDMYEGMVLIEGFTITKSNIVESSSNPGNFSVSSDSIPIVLSLCKEEEIYGTLFEPGLYLMGGEISGTLISSILNKRHIIKKIDKKFNNINNIADGLGEYSIVESGRINQANLPIHYENDNTYSIDGDFTPAFTVCVFEYEDVEYEPMNYSYDEETDKTYVEFVGLPKTDITIIMKSYVGMAYGSYSHSEGYATIANGDYSHAEGCESVADGFYSHVEGNHSTASGDYSHAEGSYSVASGEYSHAEGNYPVASGDCSHVEGNHSTASGDCSHAEGDSAEASGDYSHAEGCITTASGKYSHAEGNYPVASGKCSHAEGFHSTASGDYSHAEGSYSVASGEYSHAEGHGTIANGECQHVSGKYNVADTTSLEIIGNGESYLRSNARTLDANGNESLAGTLRIGSTTTGGVILKYESGDLKLSFDNGATWKTVTLS